MKQLKNIMTSQVVVMNPNDNVKEIAQKMKQIDSGTILFGEKDRLIGIITDRDIVIRALGENRDLNTVTARDIMSTPIVYCFEDQTIDEAARLMEVKKIRRLVVLNRDKRLVGITSLGDIAVRGDSEQLPGEILEKVAEHNKEGGTQQISASSQKLTTNRGETPEEEERNRNTEGQLAEKQKNTKDDEAKAA